MSQTENEQNKNLNRQDSSNLQPQEIKETVNSEVIREIIKEDGTESLGMQEDFVPAELEEEPEIEEEMPFLQEIIKDELPSGKRTVGKIIKNIISGLLFGLAACLGFFALKPWAESTFKPEDEIVSLPMDEDLEEEIPEEKAEEKVEEKADPPTVIVADTAPQIMDITNVKEMNVALYEVAVEAGKSVVEVTGIQEGEGWTTPPIDAVNSVSGLIVLDNGKELLILTKSRIMNGAIRLTVTFADNSVAECTLKKKDDNLGLAILSVDRSQLNEGTLSQIGVAKLGNSNAILRGSGVIALGKPHGLAGSVGVGMISSTRHSVMKADGKYKILGTDMAGTVSGSGVLVNLEGEIVGIIDQNIVGADSSSLITSLGISDLKGVIELLLNGKSIPYIGIHGEDITETIANEQGLPKGVYVRNVEDGSPAMLGGVQTGDIITSVNGNEVVTFPNYQVAVLKLVPESSVEILLQRQSPEGFVEVSVMVVVKSKE